MLRFSSLLRIALASAALGSVLIAEVAFAQAVPPTCPAPLGTADIISHDFSPTAGGTVSYCELCGIGTIRLEIENPFGPSDGVGEFTDLVVTEDLGTSGLTYVPGSTVFTTDNVPGGPPAVVAPVVSGTNGSVLTWTIDPSFALDAQPGGSGNRARLFIEFEVERAVPPLTEEGLISANRTIDASFVLEPECAPGDTYADSTGPEILPLREPEPEIVKQGRNVDANQNTFADTVYGHRHDDVIWRIRVNNVGNAPLEDVILSDTIGPGFTLDYVCPSSATATSAATGSPGACTGLGGVTTVTDLSLASVLGVPASIIAPGASADVYLVGKITSSCISGTTNTVYDVEWGCEGEAPAGGITATSTGVVPGDTATLNTQPTTANLNVAVDLIGTNLSQPMGAKGTVRIRVSNQTGGTVRNIQLRDLLPPEYVIDSTFTPTVAIARPGGHGATYDGMIDTITWTNPQAGTFPLTSTNPADPLANTELTFDLSSSTVQTITDPDPDPTRYQNMLRHGDIMTVMIRTILIDPSYYDKVANIDVAPEDAGGSPANTDPVSSFPIANELEIWFEELCTAGTTNPSPLLTNDDAEPEDIDVATGAPIYILTNTDPTPLTVSLTNNGGHDADDYFAYVTFGEAMVVDTAPAGCTATSNLPQIRGVDAPIWQLPETLPATASVYVCDVGVITAGSTRNLTFDVLKNPNPAADDDLTFRADVIGEIWLSNPDGNGNQALWFPTPTQRLPEDGLLDLANNYSLDAYRARVVGYNLTKNQLGICTENNPPPGSPDDQLQIGEECSFHVESGGWFGFETPGYDYIAVWDIAVDDLLPDGQGYISQLPPVITSQIQNVAQTPGAGPAPLDEGTFGWTFNTVDVTEWITEKDHWFYVDLTTRLLNDPVDTRAVPNLHAEISTNILLSTFEAIFFNPLTSSEERYDLGPSIIGYPPEFRRRVDLTVTEPNLILTKEVCNESLYGVGPACSNFTTLADDGDAYDTYIYRITVENEASADGVARAPAYDVTVTSVTDASDMLFVDPLTGDTLDNDGDALVDGGDAAGEGTISDNTTQNAVPAEVVAAYTHSDGLLRIDAGDSVELYYRVDPDDDVAPMQMLTSTVTASYDSLEGDFGSQTSPQQPNGDMGGARQYVSAAAAATIQIIPVETIPKQILNLSNSAVAASGPQPVSIGEEIEFELRTLIPVSQLRNFVIRDELPAGMSCAEAPAVDLDSPPYDGGGFAPGGIITPTCTATEVVWDFGNQTVTMAPGGATRFDFGIQFIARIDNVAGNQDGVVLTNGGSSTVTTASYVDEADNPVVLEFDAAQVIVYEPLIELVKTMTPDVADAADTVTVTVEATNNGTATAYNLRVLDDLSAVDLSFAANVAGANPPDSVDTTTYGPDSPIFSWTGGVAPSDTISFTFEVILDDLVQPHQVLANTVQADWTSLPGQSTALNSGGAIGPDGDATGMRIGALPNAGDTLNDYEAEASYEVTVPPLVLTKTDLDPALPPEIGAHKPFRIEIALPEGQTDGVDLTDYLDAADVSYILADNADFNVTYNFYGIATINGAPPDSASFNAVPLDGASAAAVWDIGTVVTDTEDDYVASAIDPTIEINYSARINNDLDTDGGDDLQNSADLSYVNGETAATELLTDAPPAVTAIESVLTATKALENVTAGKAPADPLALDDIAEYVVTIDNAGDATAYDVNIVDTLPIELELYGGFVPTAAIDGSPVAGFVATPAGAPDGPLVWGRDNGDETLDLPAGSFLELTYQVRVRTPAPPGVTIDNNVWTDWTSLAAASTYERTGLGCPAWTAPNDYCYGPAVAVGSPVPVPPPGPLIKANTQPTASIGEAFSYRLTIPPVPHLVPLYDVRISDDLGLSAADLEYVSVTKVAGLLPWTPVNTGTSTNLVIEDTTDGIDIQAGEQIVIDVTVIVQDTPTNVDGLMFANTASYTFNRLNGNAASEYAVGDYTSDPPMTIVEPDLTLEKTGPPQMRIGLAGTFTLNVHNPTLARAWDWTIYDQLPNTATGGMCDAAPYNITAQVFEADGTTTVSPVLVEGTDFAVNFDGDPSCTLILTMLTPAATVGPDERLIVTYQSLLDLDSEQSAVLTNVAGVTEWFSADTSNPDNEARAYARTLTDGTVGTLDHQDAHTVTVDLPVLRFEKTVVNVTTGDDPAALATPGDTLRYYLRVENLSNVAVSDFSIVDELDALNDPPVFTAGSLTLVTVPPGAITTNTNAAGGADGTGLLDVRALSIGGLGETVAIEFEVTLAPVIADGTYVLNQSELSTGGVPIAVSDDPNVNGPADPSVPDDDDPTQVQIVSAPYFDIDKISTYITGDPAVLLAGESLLYTITVKNVGTDNAIDTTLRDEVPANTSYVPGSTTLNGAPVADGPAGLFPLSGGIPLYAPEDSTPGAMRADASATTDNVATITFEVSVYPDLLDGTVISNQGFVSAVDGGVVDQPSDDPRTPIVDDPTRDVVGNLPLIYSEKSAVLQIDLGSPGVVDPGDTLRYTITTYNNGAVPATEVVLTDAVPANTSYVADSTTLNGAPVAQPDGGTSPLVAGIPISSADLTPPLPGAGGGVLTPGESAVLQFDLLVDAGVPAGTLITNQAMVASYELPSVLTDGDGNPATGPEPTVVVVGPGQQLLITKQVGVVGGGAAEAGSTLEYLVRVRNVSLVPATYVEINDDLDAPVPGQLAYVAGSATMNGVTSGVSFVGSTLTAVYGDLAPGAEILLRFRATIAPALPLGTTVTNIAQVQWNDPLQYAEAAVSIDVGGVIGVGMLSGTIWHDVNFDDVLDLDERVFGAWSVALYRNGNPVTSTQTSPDGSYRLGGLPPNYLTTDVYELRFTAPDAGPATAALGVTASPFTNYLQRISEIVVQSGSNLRNLDLPLEPNGVVYHSLARAPIPGTTVALLDAASGAPLPAACFDDPAQQNQVTLTHGYYRFDLNFSDPACPNGGDYRIGITAPGTGFIAGYSAIIPPASGMGAFDVSSCPGTSADALPATAEHCEAQASPYSPNLFASVGGTGTDYHVTLRLDDSQPPGSMAIFNNHLPLDPDLADSVYITKSTPRVSVRRGELVPYLITVTSELGFDLQQISIVDRLPPGFRYVEGSASLDDVPLEPEILGRELVWSTLGLTTSGRHEIELLLAVGSGVSEGDFVNRAQVIHELTGNALSSEAQATVRLVPDPDFDCTDVTGKVFDDRNRNGLQDPGEAGIGGVRAVTATGLAATTDGYGRFHITCATVPNEMRGSNFVLKLDDRTLPSGFRMSNQAVRIQRATRGKTLHFSFGASIYRVIGLDVSDPIFEPGLTGLRPQWQPRIGLLLEELRKAPAILRLSYLADLEEPALVNARLKTMERTIRTAWEVMDTGYDLDIEPEVFWRLGGPPEAAGESGVERRRRSNRDRRGDDGSAAIEAAEGGDR